MMTNVPLTTASVHRLAENLHQLSELAERLTYRLLELEERLAAHEKGFRPLADEATRQEEGMAEAIELRMGDTQERLARIEAVLKGLDHPAAVRLVHSLPPPVLQQEPLIAPMARPLHPRSRIEAHEALEETAHDPITFPEEGEQLFMDERIA